MPTDIKGNILEPIQEFYNVWAYNHNYYTFQASTPSNGDYSVITYGDIEYVLYPDNLGVFTFDTFEFSRELFNYKDVFDYNSNYVDSNQYKFISFNIEIFLLDTSDTEISTLDISFYNGVVQRWQSPNVLEYQSDILKPIYFNGYPFDYSEINSSEVTRTLPTDLSLFNVVEDTKNCEGIYLKYHNGKAGYDYYLFNTYSKGNYSTTSLGNIKEKFSWTYNTFELGKKGQREILAFAKIPYEYREMMYNLADSNEVYLYTGKKEDLTDLSNKWLEVKVKSMKVQETNKESAFEQNITILLPEEKTRTRI